MEQKMWPPKEDFLSVFDQTDIHNMTMKSQQSRTKGKGKESGKSVRKLKTTTKRRSEAMNFFFSMTVDLATAGTL